jgi:1-aminocyclopropane-1-carboxylate deaminase
MALIPGLNKFPKETLTFGKTPIQPLKRLSAALGGKVEIYAKREDVNSGLAFGGNKTRKLEYLVAEALQGSYTHLVSIGGVQSNQTRQVAAVAAHLGLKCVLVQEKWVNHSEDDSFYGKVGNIQLSRILGADVRLDDSGFDIGIRQSWKEALDEIEKEGGKPFPIPAGCSEHRLGGLGFVGWAEEVREQEAELGFKFDYMVVCAVTGSTQAGMIVGFAADGRARRVIGIDASAKPEQTKEQVWRIARNTAELVGLGKEIEEDGKIPNLLSLTRTWAFANVVCRRYSRHKIRWPRVWDSERRHPRSYPFMCTTRRYFDRSSVRREEYGRHDSDDSHWRNSCWLQSSLCSFRRSASFECV